MRFLFFALLLSVSLTVVYAWEQIDYEIFELVDSLRTEQTRDGDSKSSSNIPPPIQDNMEDNDEQMSELPPAPTFYQVLGLDPDAAETDIIRAHRKLSLTMHPDKNPDDPAAEQRYTRLQSIVTILKNPETRARYDYYMKNGVPVWRGTGWYYRRRRPGLPEVLTGLLIFVSAVQYLLMWVGCWREVARLKEEIEYLRKQRKGARKIKKKTATGQDKMSGVDSGVGEEDDVERIIAKPSIFDVLLFRLVLLPVTLIRMVFASKKTKSENETETNIKGNTSSSVEAAARLKARRRGDAVLWAED